MELKLTIHEARLIRQIKALTNITWRALAEVYYTPDQVGYYGDQCSGHELCLYTAELLGITEDELDETPINWRELEYASQTRSGKLLYE